MSKYMYYNRVTVVSVNYTIYLAGVNLGYSQIAQILEIDMPELDMARCAKMFNRLVHLARELSLPQNSSL